MNINIRKVAAYLLCCVSGKIVGDLIEKKKEERKRRKRLGEVKKEIKNALKEDPVNRDQLDVLIEEYLQLKMLV